MSLVDVLDGKLHALELILALHRVSTGPRHGGADRHRRALRAGRPGAERRLIVGESRHERETADRKGAEAGAGYSSGTQQMTP